MQAVADADSAAISTVHGFASRLLNEFSVAASLPPRVTVLDEVSSQLAHERRWDRFVDRLHARPGARGTPVPSCADGHSAQPGVQRARIVQGRRCELRTELGSSGGHRRCSRHRARRHRLRSVRCCGCRPSRRSRRVHGRRGRAPREHRRELSPDDEPGRGDDRRAHQVAHAVEEVPRCHRTRDLEEGARRQEGVVDSATPKTSSR